MLICSVGAVIQGPSDIIYFPNEGPIILNCTISDGSTGWSVNGAPAISLSAIRGGAIPGHNVSGTSLVINTPVNNTEYVCLSIRDEGDIPSEPAFLYIAGMFLSPYYAYTYVVLRLIV